MRATSRTWFAALFALGCTSILGIDGDYSVAADASAGGQGGSPPVGVTGGAPPSAGGSGAAGARQDGALQDSAPNPPSPSCVDNADCEPGMKCCGGSCEEPSLENGCSLTECTTCLEPVPNAEPLCEAFRCSARCRAGYVPGNGQCVPEGSQDSGTGGVAATGGSGGLGGDGGNAGAGATGGVTGGCVREECAPCLNPVLGVVRCCDRITDLCGCSWFEAAYCVE